MLAAVPLGGCGIGTDGVSALMVDPARYDGFNCKQLSSQWNELLVREKQLRNFMDKADEGGGGTVIGALAYRGDYQTVLEDKKVLQRTAAERQCQLTATPAAAPAFTSDQTIR
ncbi:MAG: twin-arginine translocation pathway signal [Xanthobacteraceae bacterium]